MWKIKPPSALYLSRVKTVFYEHILPYSSDHAGMSHLTGCIKIKKAQIIRFVLFYVYERIRTPDTLVRSQVLYPAELHTHILFTHSL